MGEWNKLLAVLVGAAVGVGVSALCIATIENGAWQKCRAEAVEAGVAEWVVTGSGGETEFRWIEPQQAGGQSDE